MPTGELGVHYPSCPFDCSTFLKYYCCKRSILPLTQLSAVAYAVVILHAEGYYLHYGFITSFTEWALVPRMGYSAYLCKRFIEFLSNHFFEISAHIFIVVVIKMGTLSYLAYSFHMFLDKPYTQIIRGIINDASI